MEFGGGGHWGCFSIPELFQLLILSSPPPFIPLTCKQSSIKYITNKQHTCHRNLFVLVGLICPSECLNFYLVIDVFFPDQRPNVGESMETTVICDLYTTKIEFKYLHFLIGQPLSCDWQNPETCSHTFLSFLSNPAVTSAVTSASKP